MIYPFSGPPQLRRPENVKVRLWLGDAFVRAGDSASAIREYRRALEIRPEYGAASANLLVPLMNLHRYPEAIEAGETARRLFTEDNAVLLMNLATAYQAVGEQVRFLECIQRALELNPGSSRAHYQLGRYYLQEGNRNAALEHLRESLRLEPDSAQSALIRKLIPGPR